MKFRKYKDIQLSEINAELMRAYERHLKENGLSRNTTSFYMRILRAVYNRAVEKRMTRQRNPFKHVYTGVERTPKRAVSFDIIKQLKEMDLGDHQSRNYARDLFLFSFYTRGMSFIDMAYLKNTDLANGMLTYRRKKTGQQMYVKWEPCMQEIVDKYHHLTSPYLLPILGDIKKKERQQYKNSISLVNRRLKDIGRNLELTKPLTMYVARHSWASIAKERNIPISIISEGMGHESEKTTMIYLSTLDTDMIDHANSMILEGL